MFQTPLAQAVAQFSERVQDLAAPDLDRPWAWGAYDSEGICFAFFRVYEDLCTLHVRLAAARADSGPSVTEAQRILAQYRVVHRDLQGALLGVDEDLAGAVPGEEAWSVRQVVAHIVGAELGFYVAVSYGLECLRSGEEPQAEIPDEVWGRLLGPEEPIRARLEGSLGEVRAFHAEIHERVLEAFATIEDEELEAPSIYWEGTPLSLRFRLHRFDSHLRQHTVQIDKALHQLGRPATEARRLLRLVYGALAGVEGAAMGAPEVGADLALAAAEGIAALTGEIAEVLEA